MICSYCINSVWIGALVARVPRATRSHRQAPMLDRPALSYGLFHAQVKPHKLYGIVTTGITFQGLNMDIGRAPRWLGAGAQAPPGGPGALGA